MKSKKDKYYGIRLNDEIPKIDKVNKFNKEVEVVFEGNAYLITRDDDNNILEKIKIENEYKLQKEDDYEIEFINEKDELYYLKVQITTSFIFLFLLLFIIGFLIGLIICIPQIKQIPNGNILGHYIDLAVLELDIDKERKSTPQIINNYKDTYDFEVVFDNISENEENSENIKLINTMSAQALAKNKIAPGVNGSFAIIISTRQSTVDMKYRVNFIDLSNEKPTNLKFNIRGEEDKYSSLQELESKLISKIKKQSMQKIIIDWEWQYENNNNLEIYDTIDTNEGKNLNSYMFNIVVTGEEDL